MTSYAEALREVSAAHMASRRDEVLAVIRS